MAGESACATKPHRRLWRSVSMPSARTRTEGSEEQRTGSGLAFRQGLTLARRAQLREHLEPVEALGPRHCGVRGRRRRQHEEARFREASRLVAELRTLPERTAVGLLAGEG